MHNRFLFACCFIILLLIIANCNETEKLNGEQLAKNYCGSCHLVPHPAELDKTTWQKNVLPKMAEQLGLAYYNGEYFTNVPDSTHPTTISFSHWQKLVTYYIQSAPATQPLQNRPPVKTITDRFIVKEGIVKEVYPSTLFVKTDPGNQRLYIANAYDSMFAVFDKELNLLSRQNIHRVATDMFFENDLHKAGERKGALNNIGILYPNDIRNGTLEHFTLTTKGKLQLDTTLTAALPRPVQVTGADIDKNGLFDYIVCGFGNTSGALYYLRQESANHFVQQPLHALPGAVKAYVDDYNKDGLPDIIALFAQAKEGILLFINKGNGRFDIQSLLSFPAVYGSSSFEWRDVNGDGLKDIIYTCGDNLDYTAHVLKHFHGVYIFLNKDNHKFEQAAFFPIHGCYKALARDFDLDGDIDIAAISYFPDRKNQPEEAFVYLENNGNFQFIPSTIKQFNSGNWITMDAGDIDGDGDEDIVLGSMLLTITTTAINIAPGVKDKPSFLLLLNSTRPKPLPRRFRVYSNH